LKGIPAWAGVIGWLLFVAVVQLRAQQPLDLPSAHGAVQHNRTIPYDDPAKKAQSVRQAREFGGYPCSGDCYDDKAGFRWAGEQGITDPDDCTGTTGSFIEGCRTYAQDRDSMSR
jgi:hypothetical protein